jgi:hypothetical protein
MSGLRVGSVVGTIAGLMFVLVNADEASDPWPAILRVLGLVAAVVVLGVVMRTPVDAAGRPPPRRAWRIYGWSVLAMVLAIPLGSTLLNGPLDAPEFTVLWVIAVVGAHFLPFASAFDAPLFRPLALTMLGLAAVGALATFVAGAGAASLTAVVVGFVLLGFVARGALGRDRGTRIRTS